MTLQNEIESKVKDILKRREWGFLSEEGGKSHGKELTFEETLNELVTLIQDREKEAVKDFVTKVIEANIEFKDKAEVDRFRKRMEEYLESVKSESVKE